MTAQYTYTLSEEDHLAFWRLISRAQYRKVLLWITPVVLAIAVWYVVTTGILAGVILLVSTLIASLLAGRGVDWLLLPWASRRAFRENVLLQEEVKMSLSDDKLMLSQKSGHLELQWCDALKWDESETVFAIFAARNLGYVIPKVSVPSSVIAAVRSRLISSGLTEKGQRRK